MNNTIDFISADRRGLFRTLLLLGVHFRTVRVYPRGSAANKKSPRKSAAKTELLASLLLILCIIPINAQQHTYSIDQLKKHTWTETRTSFEEKIVETLRFTDKEMISSRTRTWLKNNESSTYTFKNPYYLANGKASRFNYSLPGKVKRGCYIIHGNHNKKKYVDQFVSMEIIQLDDQELTLYWCVPEGNIGGCDTATYRSEIWKPRPPKRKSTVPFYLKQPDK
jgi:hypothetical protein